MQQLVSIIIPAFRARPFILRAVRSALSQGWANLEVVIGSDDGVDYASLLREAGVDDPRVRCVFTGGVGMGPAGARNAALAAAAGRVVATLDADDTLAPTALEVLAPLALVHGAAYCRPRLVDDETGAELPSSDLPIPRGLVRLAKLLDSHLHTYAGIVFDRARVTATWPEWTERWEDVYFFARCYEELDALYHVPEPLYTYHRVQGSVCNRPEAGHEFREGARQLAARMERGERLGLENDASRATFLRYMRSRHTIETAYLKAVRDGHAGTFQEYVRLRSDLFSAEAEGEPARALIPAE